MTLLITRGGGWAQKCSESIWDIQEGFRGGCRVLVQVKPQLRSFSWSLRPRKAPWGMSCDKTVQTIWGTVRAGAWLQTRSSFSYRGCRGHKSNSWLNKHFLVDLFDLVCLAGLEFCCFWRQCWWLRAPNLLNWKVVCLSSKIPEILMD